ncbi:MAG: ComEC/Rec2 family competence protein, partial [Verrucomicrobiota bacterium]
NLETRLYTGVPPDLQREASLIAAMALGVREGSPEDLEEWFQLSGTLHLFAVSGMHVATLAGLIFGTGRLLGLRRRSLALLVIPLVIAYAFITGLRPSAVRAALMISLFCSGIAFLAKPKVINSLGLAAVILILFDTQQVFRPGFQLSFLVVLSIACLAPVVQRYLERPFLPDPFIPRSLLSSRQTSIESRGRSAMGSVALSIAAWVGSAGLMITLFDHLAPIGLIANLPMIPLAAAIVCVAFISILCSLLPFAAIHSYLNLLNTLLTSVLVFLAQTFAMVPGGQFHIGQTATLPEQLGQISVLGRGDESAVLIELSNQEKDGNSTWLFDTGDERTYHRELLPMMRKRGLNRIDYLFLTHGDKAHIGAAPLILERWRPSVLFETRLDNRSSVYPEIDKIASAGQIERQYLEAGSRIKSGRDQIWTVLAPRPDQAGRLADDRCLVVRLEISPWRILLTSDAGFETERALLEAGVDLRADLWIRGQHQEGTTVGTAFFNAISPRAIISSHASFPSVESLPDSLRSSAAASGCAIYDPRIDGVIEIVLTPKSLRIEPFLGASAPSLEIEKF